MPDFKFVRFRRGKPRGRVEEIEFSSSQAASASFRDAALRATLISVVPVIVGRAQPLGDPEVQVHWRHEHEVVEEF